jgi:hypothetical protein
MLDKEEWCIVQYGDEDLIVRKVYQWEAQAYNYAHKWKYVARGAKSNEEACEWARKFNKLLMEK